MDATGVSGGEEAAWWNGRSCVRKNEKCLFDVHESSFRGLG